MFRMKWLATAMAGLALGLTMGCGSDDEGGSDAVSGPITWLHTDVSSWPVTTKLDARIAGGFINFGFDKTRVWPAVGGVNANTWVFVKLNGQWYAATFEYLRFGVTSRPVGVLDGTLGDHIKQSPLDTWRPRSGERIGLMVSGLARAQARNVSERSNIVMATWP